MVPSPPQQMLDEPGRGETAASLAHLQEKDNLSMDDLMKVTMLKMLQSQKTGKSRNCPGCPNGRLPDPAKRMGKLGVPVPKEEKE